MEPPPGRQYRSVRVGVQVAADLPSLCPRFITRLQEVLKMREMDVREANGSFWRAMGLVAQDLNSERVKRLQPCLT